MKQAYGVGLRRSGRAVIKEYASMGSRARREIICERNLLARQSSDLKAVRRAMRSTRDQAGGGARP